MDLRCMRLALTSRVKVEKAVDRGLQRMSHAQKKIGDERDSDLDTDGILTGADELADLQRSV